MFLENVLGDHFHHYPHSILGNMRKNMCEILETIRVGYYDTQTQAAAQVCDSLPQ